MILFTRVSANCAALSNAAPGGPWEDCALLR